MGTFIIVGLLVYFFSLIRSLSLFSPSKTETSISAQFRKYVPIDELITGFATVPLLDYEKGALKRTLWLGEDVNKGFCYRLYEVSIGYKSTKEIFDHYLDIACSGTYDQLPPPIILGSNAIKSEVRGSYAQKSVTNGTPVTLTMKSSGIISRTYAVIIT